MYPPDVEPNDISEANSYNSFAINVVEEKENIKICASTNADNKFFGVKAETAYGRQNNEFTLSGSGLLCKTTSLLVIQRH